MPTTNLILPFAVPAKERVKAFSPNMELASVLFLTESQRKKRRFLEAAPRKTLFISKLHYPFWAVPWGDRCLILDGLGAFSTKIQSDALPDVTTFIDDIERGESVREQFRGALEKHAKTFFGDSTKTGEAEIRALIKDTSLLGAILEFTKEASTRGLITEGTVGLVPLVVDEELAADGAKQLANLGIQGQTQIRALTYARNLLTETLRFHEQMIAKEVESTREAFEVEISKFRPAVEKKVERLLRERDSRLVKVNRVVQNALRTRESERERRERELQRLELSKADYLRRRESRKRRHDKIGEAQWKHRIKAYEKRAEETKSRIRSLSEFIEKIRRQGEADAERLRYGYQALIDQEQRKMVDIEVRRDKITEAKQEEIEKLKVATGQIVDQIDQLVEKEKRREEELGKLAMPMPIEDITLVCLPFYLASFQTTGMAEFQVFAPFSVVGSEGFFKTFQKTISLSPGSRLKLLLQPKFKDLGKVLDLVLGERMKSDKIFYEALLQVASSYNVLERQNFSEELAKGVKELVAEGWINRSQGESLIRTYTWERS